MICGTYFRGIVCTLHGASRRGIVATMELTEQRSLRHEYETARGGARRGKRLSCSEIKILLAQASPVAAPRRSSRSCRRNSAPWIDLSIIESRRSTSRFSLAFPSLAPARAPDRVLNHERNNRARDSAGLLITVAGLAIKMGITFAGLKFYSRRAAPP